MCASATLSARWRVSFTMIYLNAIALKYAERSRSVQLKKYGNQNSSEILRLLFGNPSEKIPFFRSRSEEDPNMIRRNGFSNRSKPVKSSQNRSEFFMVVENGHFCGNFTPFIKKYPSKTSKKTDSINSVIQTNQPSSTLSEAEAYGYLRNIFIKILSEIKSLRLKQIERVKKYCVLCGFKQL